MSTSSTLRMPRQTPGIHRGPGRGAAGAVAAAGGVEAAGIFEWLFGPGDVTDALDGAGNFLLGLNPVTNAIAHAASPFIP